jgi:hypothetical protein
LLTPPSNDLTMFFWHIAFANITVSFQDEEGTIKSVPGTSKGYYKTCKSRGLYTNQCKAKHTDPDEGKKSTGNSHAQVLKEATNGDLDSSSIILLFHQVHSNSDGFTVHKDDGIIQFNMSGPGLWCSEMGIRSNGGARDDWLLLDGGFAALRNDLQLSRIKCESGCEGRICA